MIPRYGSIDLKNARRVWERSPSTSGRTAMTPPSIRRRRRIRSTWWTAPRSSTARDSTARPAWTTRTTTFASPFSRAPRWAWRVTSSAPTSSTATTGRPAWSPPTCAPPSPPTRPSSAAAPSSPSTTWATRDCSRTAAACGGRRSTPPSTGPDGMEFFGQVSYIKGGIPSPTRSARSAPPTRARSRRRNIGFGLDGALRAAAGVLTGILNGVDYAEWNPGRGSASSRRTTRRTT